MKKILLITLLIASANWIGAQTVEIIGRGVLEENTSNPTITITDFGNVEQVVVEAMAYIVTNSNASLETDDNFDVSFNGVGVDFKYMDVLKKDDGNPYPRIDGDWTHKGYYTHTFAKSELATNVITLDKNDLDEGIMSFYVYVFRTDPDVNSMTHPDEERAFVYENGSGNPMVYDFSLAGYDVKKITIQVPFSDNEDISEDPRDGTIEFTDGTHVVSESDFVLNDPVKQNFHVIELEIDDVPESATNAIVKIYSPEDEGDSFWIGLPILSIEEEPGCTLTQGYWKNHNIRGNASKKSDPTWALVGGPDAIFYSSGQTWYEVFDTPVKGNAYYQLAHQYMAAVLNTKAGASVPDDVQDALDDGDAIFLANGPAYYEKVKGKTIASDEEVAELISLASILADYNEGKIGPGHCDDLEELEKSAIINADGEIAGLTVYPNPVRNVSTLSFKTLISGRVTVDMYNSVGQRVTRLMDRNVMEGMPVNINISGQDYREGLYLLRVQNENSRSTIKVQINR